MHFTSAFTATSSECEGDSQPEKLTTHSNAVVAAVVWVYHVSNLRLHSVVW